jgi:UDP-N-acetylmuramate dehydrogenase
MLQQNISLRPFNTFSVDVQANYFADITESTQLGDFLTQSTWQLIPKLILGGGSNILLTKNFPGLVLKISIKGIKIVAEDENHVWLSVGAGEIWHQFVCYCVQHQYGGIENLSLIPGTVGAAPIQNIGAYGIELKEVFSELEALNISNGQLYRFNQAECQFGYRDSIFKRTFKNQFIITQVTFRLNKKLQFCLEYAGLKHALDEMGIADINLQQVSTAICKIRQDKLPDPTKIANAGSFFKNPMISANELIKLQQKYSKIPHYPAESNQFKIPAAWLIEQCGWKGYRHGHVGVYPNHALVLVNYGQGSGAEIKQLAHHISESVHEKFAINLETEVNII